MDSALENPDDKGVGRSVRRRDLARQPGTGNGAWGSFRRRSPDWFLSPRLCAARLRRPPRLLPGARRGFRAVPVLSLSRLPGVPALRLLCGATLIVRSARVPETGRARG